MANYISNWYGTFPNEGDGIAYTTSQDLAICINAASDWYNYTFDNVSYLLSSTPTSGSGYLNDGSYFEIHGSGLTTNFATVNSLGIVTTDDWQYEFYGNVTINVATWAQSGSLNHLAIQSSDWGRLDIDGSVRMGSSSVSITKITFSYVDGATLQLSGSLNYNQLTGITSGNVSSLKFIDDVGHSFAISGFSNSFAQLDAAGDVYSLVANIMAGNDSMIGTAVSEVMLGYGGNDTINGGLGADTLDGGDGNDTYIVDNMGDAVIDRSGIDIVKSSVTFDLSVSGTGVEKLTLTGTKAISGYGNELDNTITGNAAANTLTGADGNDTLNGGLGNDQMLGGLGDDSYIVNSSKDVIIEGFDEGQDSVSSSANYTLTANVENLTLTGVTAINGTGNELNNILTGNAAANTLIGLDGDDVLIGGGGNDKLLGGAGNDNLMGGAGNDKLWGGDGADHFVFNTALSAATNVDKVMDFSQGDDLIMLSNSVFAALGGDVTEDEIHSGAGFTTATTTDQHLIYNTTTGGLYYDADGAGGAAAKLFAVIDQYGLSTSHPDALTASDFGVFA